MAFFGDIEEQKKMEIASEETTKEGLIIRQFKYENLNVKTTSNKPSEKALKQAAQTINTIAAKYVDQEYNQNKD